MSKPTRFGSAISLVALATVIAGCAAPQNHASSASGKPSGEVGVATRAIAALAANDPTTAIGYAEKAVENSPNEANFRALLGTAYFAAGRFASAEAAFKDSLSIDANQPQVTLKVALAQIAQGKNAEAVATLESGRGVIDPADYGLALALAGRASDAVAMLGAAARAEGADARVRQNLALSYALSGDWTSARTIAAQDVPADQLDGRMHQWLQLANPAKPGDQLAALIGISPAASDPGEPTRLALVKPDNQLAQAVPAAPVEAPVPQVAEAAVPPVGPMEAAPGDAPVTSTEASSAPSFAAEVTAPPPPPVAKPARVVQAKLPKLAVRRAGKSGAVVQIGAYGNAQRVAAAWNAAARRYGALREFTPMSARFDSPKGTFYRLSVKGFANVNQANALCASLRRGGGTCFVRKVAGDTPVQIASR